MAPVAGQHCVAILAQPVLDCAVVHTRAIVALHLAVALFGVAGLFGVWLAMPPAEITLGRALVAALALGLFARLRGEAGALARPGVRMVVNGAILAVHWTAFFAAIEVAGVATGLLGFASFPLFAVLLERWLLGRALSRYSVAAVALVTVGLLLVAGAPRAGPGQSTGLAWGVASGATFAWLAVRNRAHVRERSPTALALWQNAFAALWLVPVLAASGAWQVPTPAQWMLIAVLGVACTALAHTLFIASMRALTAHAASVAAALEPVYGIALAALLAHERPAPVTLAGGVLIIAAAIVASGRPAARI